MRRLSVGCLARLTAWCLLALTLVVIDTPGRAKGAQRWSAVLHPAAGPARIIGSYTAGCIQGAIPLPPEGEGFQTMRRERHRYFGHPTLVRYVQEIGRFVARRGLGVLNIGDLGQARGGPTPYGHRSHQIGLDADIWFWLTPPGSQLSAKERESLQSPSMLTVDRQGLDTRLWSAAHPGLLQAAAQFNTVDRIFVHPLIKQALCNAFPGATWLQKVRPWWGHDDHFHVRLRCPAEQTACQSQQPLPPGDGCDASLAWWLTAEAQPPPKTPPDLVQLPAACQEILTRQ
jgi:penicillin-insensitive murein endopeptidase